MEVESLQRRKEENDLEEEHSIQNKQIYIENDKKYHQASSMMSLALLENEIKQVIGSTISSNEANQDVKQYLEAKRKELEGVHKVNFDNESETLKLTLVEAAQYVFSRSTRF